MRANPIHLRAKIICMEQTSFSQTILSKSHVWLKCHVRLVPNARASSQAGSQKAIRTICRHHTECMRRACKQILCGPCMSMATWLSVLGAQHAPVTVPQPLLIFSTTRLHPCVNALLHCG